VSEKFSAYGKKVHDELLAAGIRSELGDANESLGKRIRSAEMMKIPYVLVVGEKEEQAKTINFRERGSDGKTTEMKLGEFIKKLVEEVKKKRP
jgi:threonyl-tRNA synthetase